AVPWCLQWLAAKKLFCCYVPKAFRYGKNDVVRNNNIQYMQPACYVTLYELHVAPRESLGLNDNEHIPVADGEPNGPPVEDAGAEAGCLPPCPRKNGDADDYSEPGSCKAQHLRLPVPPHRQVHLRRGKRKNM
ncbi:hypothetical protein TELCIR_18197, partial [Teladorsagia circumcincta]